MSFPFPWCRLACQPHSLHQAAQLFKHIYQRFGPYTQASLAIKALLQASLAQLVQCKELWSVRVLPDVVLEFMEEAPLADYRQYHVPLTQVISNGELC
jgi:hypothetical protein